MHLAPAVAKETRHSRWLNIHPFKGQPPLASPFRNSPIKRSTTSGLTHSNVNYLWPHPFEIHPSNGQPPLASPTQKFTHQTVNHLWPHTLKNSPIKRSTTSGLTHPTVNHLWPHPLKNSPIQRSTTSGLTHQTVNHLWPHPSNGQPPLASPTQKFTHQTVNHLWPHPLKIPLIQRSTTSVLTHDADHTQIAVVLRPKTVSAEKEALAHFNKTAVGKHFAAGAHKDPSTITSHSDCIPSQAILRNRLSPAIRTQPTTSSSGLARGTCTPGSYRGAKGTSNTSCARHTSRRRRRCGRRI
jgi:hypothetical protein